MLDLPVKGMGIIFTLGKLFNLFPCIIDLTFLIKGQLLRPIIRQQKAIHHCEWLVKIGFLKSLCSIYPCQKISEEKMKIKGL